jgi:hypothetical protein
MASNCISCPIAERKAMPRALDRPTCTKRWTAIAAKLPARSPLSVKNRWNWLVRHGETAEPKIDVVVKRKPRQPFFEPLDLDEKIFGSAFHEFQVKMLIEHAPQ